MDPAIFVAWPGAPLTTSLVHTSIAALGLSTSILSTLPSPPPPTLIQWASYDCIDHALTAAHPNHVLSSSYTIRKALIRKHFLARCIQSYLVKRPGSFLAKAVPLTWDIDIAYADELDEMWSDELWDLGSTLDGNNTDIKQWFILKPGMADRGMGIRLFDSKDALHSIFREFDCDPDEDEADESTTSVMTSQLRHFVLQVCELIDTVITQMKRTFRNTFLLLYLSTPTKFHCQPQPNRHAIYEVTKSFCFVSCCCQLK